MSMIISSPLDSLIQFAYHYINKEPLESSTFFLLIQFIVNHQVLIVPVLTSFGLIFKDKFKELNMTALESTLILNLNSALGMTLGLFNGALLNCFGYRKIAVVGGMLFSSGLIATSWANSFKHFLITYSIITCEGVNLNRCIRDDD